MALLINVDGVYCSHCGQEGLMRETKEEATGWKVYAQCSECEKKFGRVGFITTSNVERPDEAYAKAEDLVARRAGL